MKQPIKQPITVQFFVAAETLEFDSPEAMLEKLPEAIKSHGGSVDYVLIDDPILEATATFRDLNDDVLGAVFESPWTYRVYMRFAS